MQEILLNMVKWIFFIPIITLCLLLLLCSVHYHRLGKIMKNNYIFFVGLVTGICFLIIFFVSFVLPVILIKEYGVKFGEIGSYGDLFGCFNSLISALALGGLIYTIILQQKELSLQREELKLNREELKRQAAAQEHSATEQETQAELIEDQINKDIRPYINAYWDNRGNGVYFVIKNVGKCAASDFSMQVSTNSLSVLLKYFLVKTNDYRLNVVPSQLEYVIPLSDPYDDTEISDAEKWKKMIENGTVITANFEFIFRGKKEKFKIVYDIKDQHFSENVDAKYKERLLYNLRSIGNSHNW